MVKAAVREAPQQAVFSFLVLLDGVASIGKGRDGKLKLFYSERERRVLLNDPAKEELHNLFNKIPLESRSDRHGGAQTLRRRPCVRTSGKTGSRRWS